MPQGKGTYGSKRGRPPIKAHKGMAHIPKSEAPSKAKGTAGTTRRPKRMVGLPQKFMGSSSSRKKPIEAPKISPKTARPILPKIYEDKVEKPVGPIRDDFGRPPPIQSPNKPKTPVAPVIRSAKAPAFMNKMPKVIPKPISKSNEQAFLKNISQKTDTFKNKQNAAINRFKKSQRDAMNRFNRLQRDSRNTFRTVNKGGYISRAKYGIVDNLKGK